MKYKESLFFGSLDACFTNTVFKICPVKSFCLKRPSSLVGTSMLLRFDIYALCKAFSRRSFVSHIWQTYTTVMFQSQLLSGFELQRLLCISHAYLSVPPRAPTGWSPAGSSCSGPARGPCDLGLRGHIVDRRSRRGHRGPACVPVPPARPPMEELQQTQAGLR